MRSSAPGTFPPQVCSPCHPPLVQYACYNLYESSSKMEWHISYWFHVGRTWA